MTQAHNVMMYQSGMQCIDSDLLDQVLAALSSYQSHAPYHYNHSTIQQALQQSPLTPEGMMALLSPQAKPLLESLAQRAKQTTLRYFGNHVSLFTPLYLSNHCQNSCVYCGFSAGKPIVRAKLNPDEMKRELERIAQTGLQEILLLTGESTTQTHLDYLLQAVELSTKYMSTIGLEVHPMGVEEYRQLHQAGADFISVYQETYDLTCYDKMHPYGAKRSFPYRFYAQERALKAGMRGVSFGVLLGLSNFTHDVYAMLLHAGLLHRKYPHAELSFSFPRLRPTTHQTNTSFCFVDESSLLQAMLVCRLAFPFASITISTRERPIFRDHVVGMVATKMSAGVSMEIASQDQPGEAQFLISDERSVTQISNMLFQQQLQPVFQDHLYLSPSPSLENNL